MSQSSVNWVKIISISEVNERHKGSQAHSSGGTKTPIHRRRWMRLYISRLPLSLRRSWGRAAPLLRVWQVMSPQTTRFIYKLHNAAQTNRRETGWVKGKRNRGGEREREREKERERERKYQRALRMSLEKSEIMQRQRSKDIAFPPGNHPGYQVEVIMLWSANEFIS